MSALRPTADCDLYVYRDVRGGWVCCDYDTRLATATEMIEHVKQHKSEGHRVPVGFAQRIRDEDDFINDMINKEKTNG